MKASSRSSSKRWILRGSLFLAGTFLLQACGQKKNEEEALGATGAPYCQESLPTSPVTGTSGLGKVFEVDPMVSSGNSTLSPASTALDSYTASVSLPNLLGYGTLQGSYVKVITDRCFGSGGGSTYGAFDSGNDFRFPHEDDRFAEVMNYYHGDRFRTELSAASALYPAAPFYIIANCDVQDNAYYSPPYGSQPPFVCMGYSKNYSATTSFSDDSEVTIHEMQHGVTGHAYSMIEDLNKFDYDEAGAINEAISDFVALMQKDTEIVSPFLNHEFSRWGLGQFFSTSLMRGAAKCPVWADDYPNCSYFNKGASGFSAASRQVSFAYPDGLGWPYAGPSVSATLKSVYQGSSGFEEIHQTAPIITGALFDIYESLKASTGDAATTRKRMLHLVVEAIKALPKASASNLSPVTMPVLATTINSTASSIVGALSFTGTEITTIANKLADRGLTGIPLVADGWASVGTGSAQHAGIFFYETTGTANRRLQPGERGAIWFDIQNSSANTAAAPYLRVTSDSAYVKFSSASLNPGYRSASVAHVRYSKINGTSIQTKMNNGTATQNTGISNSYFGANSNTLPIPLGVNIETALYIEISSSAPSGHTVNFTVEIEPANKTSANATVTFPVTLP